MAAWDAIRARRNVRSYLPDPIQDADLDRIAEAGRRAPSARNQQHWDFVIVTDLGQATTAMTIAATDLGIGYPADRPLKPIVKPDRRPFTDVVHHGRW